MIHVAYATPFSFFSCSNPYTLESLLKFNGGFVVYLDDDCQTIVRYDHSDRDAELQVTYEDGGEKTIRGDNEVVDFISKHVEAEMIRRKAGYSPTVAVVSRPTRFHVLVPRIKYTTFFVHADDVEQAKKKVQEIVDRSDADHIDDWKVREC